MEGLLIDVVLRRLQRRLPAERLGWRVIEPHLVVLPLVGDGALVIDLRPSSPGVRIGPAPDDARTPRGGFGAALAAHAAGPLREAQQAGLDRRFTLRFGAGEGFVPTPEARLEVELTGRNANAVLIGRDDRIVAVHREVRSGINRYRELAPGMAYRPPPPYTKLDPRTTDRAVLASVLRGRPLARAFERVDGIGPGAAGRWAELAGVAPGEPLEGPAVDAVLEALGELLRDPERVLQGASGSFEARSRSEERERLERGARAVLQSRLRLLERRVADAERARAAAADAPRLRSEADLLLAHTARVPKGADEVELEGFDGTPVLLDLDPRLDVAANARRRYDAARSREARAVRAGEAAEHARVELDDVRARLEGLASLDDDALRAIAGEDAPRRRGRAAPIGLRVEGPHGFEIVIGRSAKENDRVTFGVARSDDLWLHAQGYRGAHVVVRADGREIPFDTVLFAAGLAAGHSEAAGGDNVPVDYTRKRFVWRSKGMPPGAVRFSQQKTVFVTPVRRGDVA